MNYTPCRKNLPFLRPDSKSLKFRPHRNFDTIRGELSNLALSCDAICAKYRYLLAFRFHSPRGSASFQLIGSVMKTSVVSVRGGRSAENFISKKLAQCLPSTCGSFSSTRDSKLEGSIISISHFAVLNSDSGSHALQRYNSKGRLEHWAIMTLPFRDQEISGIEVPVARYFSQAMSASSLRFPR